MRLSSPAKACWLGALLAAASALAATTVYKKLGGEVVFTPGSVPVVIKSITWREGSNLAMEWDDSDPKISSYRQFKDRGRLNISNGQMTITELTRNDSNVYTVDINGKTETSVVLGVISAVAVPNVIVSCNDEKTSCVLTCNGGSAEAEPVTYTWKSDDGATISPRRELNIASDNSSVKQFRCELENPVSLESSAPIASPLLPNTPPPGEDESQAKVIKGVIVFVCLLLPLLLVVFIHRCKTGVWFYEKESLPWSQGFWRKENTSEDGADPRRSQTEEEEEKLKNNGDSGPQGQGGSDL